MEERVDVVEAELSKLVEEVAVVAELLQLVRERTSKLGRARPPRPTRPQATLAQAVVVETPQSGSLAAGEGAAPRMTGDDRWFAVCMILAELLSSAHFMVGLHSNTL